MEHGTSTAYGRGCRCSICKAGRAAYAREWRRRNPDSGKVERSCERCATKFMAWPPNHSPHRKRTGIYCSTDCARTTPGTGWRSNLVRPGHPLAGADGRVLAHRFALYEHIGDGAHPCHWCKTSLNWGTYSRKGKRATNDLIVDHLDSNPRNNSISNLVPACQRCNALRGLIRRWQETTNQPISDLIP
jgi:hypothetical protein